MRAQGGGESEWREAWKAVDPKVRLVFIIAAIQSGKTSVGELGLCHIIANHPGPTLWRDQTDDDAKDQAESRLHKLFEDCARVRRLIPGDRHKKRNTTIHFRNGMTLWVLGAHNKTNLQRRSIRWLIGDETWRWPVGHMAEAEARVTAFGWLGKCVFMSQGGEENDDTHRKFETTDMREWMFQCPKCGTRQPWSWDQIEWSKSARDEAGEWDYAEVRRTAAMRCASCNHYFDDSDRTRRELNATGRFVVQNPRAAKESAGFHWNALCTMSWGRACRAICGRRPSPGVATSPHRAIGADATGVDFECDRACLDQAWSSPRILGKFHKTFLEFNQLSVSG